MPESTGRRSPSSVHQHFKALTSMTPLRFQKQLRRLEARGLMVTEAADVAEAAYKVGYESASQSSRGIFENFRPRAETGRPDPAAPLRSMRQPHGVFSVVDAAPSGCSPDGAFHDVRMGPNHSHSIVPGGLLVTS
jgi:hypothetical protein